METVTAKIDAAGRLVVPVQIRKGLNWKPNTEVILQVEAGGLRVETRDEALRRVQRRLARHKKPGRSVVDEFLAERRKEALREVEGR